MINMKSVTLFLLILLSTSFLISCETESDMNEDTVVEHRKSPIVISSVLHEDTYIKVVYGQPYKRGRDIFGGLEPYGEVWRTGANEATEITITQAIRMEGQSVEPGTYALFTIPGEDEWTIILNEQLGQWGAFDYNEEYDYIRFNVPAQETDRVIEALTITFDETEENRTILSIAWDDTRVEIPIDFL